MQEVHHSPQSEFPARGNVLCASRLRVALCWSSLWADAGPELPVAEFLHSQSRQQNCSRGPALPLDFTISPTTKQGHVLNCEPRENVLWDRGVGRGASLLLLQGMKLQCCFLAVTTAAIVSAKKFSAVGVLQVMESCTQGFGLFAGFSLLGCSLEGEIGLRMQSKE